MAVKTASFLSGLQPPGALEGQDLGLEQQQLLEALKQQQGNTSVPVTPGGRYNALNFDGLANSLLAHRTKSKLENNRRKQADLLGKGQATLLAELAKYDSTDIETVKRARTSPHAEIRSLAEDDLKAIRSRGDKLVDRVPVTDAARTEDYRQWGAKPNQKVVGDSIVNIPEQGSPVLTAGGWSTPAPDKTGAMVQTNSLTGEVRTVNRAATSTTNVTLGNAPLAEAMKVLPDDYKAALAYGRTLQNTEQALDALRQGARAGYGEQFFQNARTLVSGLTGIKFEATTPTAVLAKSLAENTLQEFGGRLGAGISNADVLFMQQATGGLTDDPKALERILAIRAGVAHRRLQLHNRNVEEVASNPKNDVQEFTRRRYSVESPNFQFSFTNPDADASFRSIVGGMTLERARELNATEAKQGFGQPTATKTTTLPPEEQSRKQRLEALGLPYTPLPGGRK